MVPLTGHLIDAIDIGGVEEVAFINGEVVGLAVDLAGRGVDQPNSAVMLPTGLKNRELGATVDLQVGIGIAHGVEMARLTSQVEEVVLPLNQVVHRVLITDIGDVEADPAVDPIKIMEIAAVLWDE